MSEFVRRNGEDPAGKRGQFLAKRAPFAKNRYGCGPVEATDSRTSFAVRLEDVCLIQSEDCKIKARHRGVERI